MDGQMDTFDNMAPVEPVDAQPEASATTTQEPAIDSFDNEEVILPKEEQMAKAEKETKEAMDNDQTKKLDEEDEKESEKGKKEEEKSESEEKEEVKAEEKPAPKGKVLKGKVDGEAVDLDPNTTFKVKVKGKGEIVPLQDLINNYSGQKAFDEDFTKLSSERDTFKQELSTYKEERQQVEGLLTSVMEKIDDPEGNPIDALNFLLEKTGRNVYDFNKRVLNTLRTDLTELDGMDEVEQELYWKNKEVDYLKRHQESELSRRKNEESRRNHVREIDQLREARGVTEEQYISAHRELSELGYKELNPQQVIDFSEMKPFVIKAEEAVNPYIEDLDDSDVSKLVSGVAELLHGYPHISEEQALEISAKKLGYDVSAEDEVIGELKDKLSDQEDKSARKPKGDYRYGGPLNQEQPESFDDYDNYGYQGS